MSKIIPWEEFEEEYAVNSQKVLVEEKLRNS